EGGLRFLLLEDVGLYFLVDLAELVGVERGVVGLALEGVLEGLAEAGALLGLAPLLLLRLRPRGALGLGRGRRRRPRGLGVVLGQADGAGLEAPLVLAVRAGERPHRAVADVPDLVDDLVEEVPVVADDD